MNYIKTPPKKKKKKKHDDKNEREEQEQDYKKQIARGKKEMQTKQGRAEGNKYISIWLVSRKLKWGLSQGKKSKFNTHL